MLDLLATLAHELRTPLATQRAVLDVLAEVPTLPPDEARQMVRQLQRSVTWLEGLVENLALSVMAEMGGLSPGSAFVRLKETIQEAVDLVQPQLERKRQRVEVLCAAPSPVVRGDARALGRIIINLLMNASVYGPPGDTIEVEARAAADRVQVRVTDHGPGIPVREQSSIFERFVRGKTAAGNYARGLGLGLHIVKSIVEMHGGVLGVDSRRGQGASFWFALPCVAESEVPDDGEPSVNERAVLPGGPAEHTQVEGHLRPVLSTP